MKYKPGDKVRIKDINWYNANVRGFGVVITEDDICFNSDMVKFCNSIVTIESVDEIYRCYTIVEDVKPKYIFNDEMIDGLVEPKCTEKLISIDDVCIWLNEHLSTSTKTGDYDYGEEYIVSDYNNSYEFIEAFRKTFSK